MQRVTKINLAVYRRTAFFSTDLQTSRTNVLVLSEKQQEQLRCDDVMNSVSPLWLCVFTAVRVCERASAAPVCFHHVQMFLHHCDAEEKFKLDSQGVLLPLCFDCWEDLWTFILDGHQK